MEYDRVSLEEWQRYQPLSVLQLDIADRAVLRIAGTSTDTQDWSTHPPKYQPEFSLQSINYNPDKIRLGSQNPANIFEAMSV